MTEAEEKSASPSGEVRKKEGPGFVHWIVGWVGIFTLRSLYATLRLEVFGSTEGMQGKVLGLWHQQFAIYTPWIRAIGLAGNRSPKPLVVLVSDHRDGEYLAQTIHRLPVLTVRGDSRRKPIAGLKGILRVLKDGHPVCFAVDGPVGPAKIVQPGIIMASLMSKKPVSMVVVDAERRFDFRSWDRFFLPKPFTRARLKVLPDFHPDPEKSAEENARVLGELALRAEEEIRFPRS